MEIDMRERWMRLWGALGGNGGAATAYARVTAAYAEPHRAYHSLVHVERCLWLLDRFEGSAQHRLACEWAFWMHDVVCVSGATDNEERSAMLSTWFLENAGIGRAIERYANGLILATRFGHAPNTPDERLVIDVDHSVLGEPADVFDEYDLAIRQEYAFIPWEAYVARRSGVLATLAARSPFFFTDAFRASAYESSVHDNLHRAIVRLASAPDPLLAP